MTPEVKDLIKRASKHLAIKDIMLFESLFERPERDPEKMGRAVKQEYKREVRYFTDDKEKQIEGPPHLQVLIALGIRLSAVDGSAEDAPFVVIEADFLVNYEMSDDLDPDCIKAFANNNAVHNVWPFWRQHVFDIVARARLPQLEIPLYSGIIL